MQRIKDYCHSGKPVVGVRTASHAIQTWLDLDKEVLGGNYKGHYGNDLATDVEIVEADADDPLLAGVEAVSLGGQFVQESGHRIRLPRADDRHEPRGHRADHLDPEYKGGRVFYTSLGHQKDFQEESFRRLLANALFWAAGRDVEPKPTQ